VTSHYKDNDVMSCGAKCKCCYIIQHCWISAKAWYVSY